MLTFTKEGAHQLTTVTTVSTNCIVVLHQRALSSMPLQYSHTCLTLRLLISENYLPRTTINGSKNITFDLKILNALQIIPRSGYRRLRSELTREVLQPQPRHHPSLRVRRREGGATG
jgi:hypothetical protein